MRRTSVALSAAVALLALAACSSGSPKASSASASGGTAAPAPSASVTAVNAAALVQQASKATGALKSAHLHVTSVLAGKTSVIDGDVSYHPVELSMSVDPGSGQKIEERLLHDTMYIKIPGAPSGKPWASISLKQISQVSGLDLSSLLDNTSSEQSVQLLTTSGDVKRVGTETVGGVPTTHLSGTVDLQKAYAQLPKATQKTLTSMVKSLKVKNEHIDLWVNAQQIPVKVVESYSSSLGSGTSTMLLTHINDAAAIKAPPASQIGKLG
jgi:hypothetical protein